MVAALSGTIDFQLALEALSHRAVEDAIELLSQAERRGYDADECAARRWICWMLAGKFENAWRESDAISRRGNPDPHRLWDGLSFRGKRVMIRCLHGFGDAIQFVRYAKLVRGNQASRVIVQVHPELVSLMRGASFVDEVISWCDEGSVGWDQQIEVMELPGAFQTTLDTIPGEIPYLRLTPQQRQGSRIVPRHGTGLRIGLQWGSSGWNVDRSVALRELRPVLGMAGIEYFSFQRGASREELAMIGEGYPIQDVSGTSPHIVEAAADLMNIDVLITVDTMLAHLAGALGREVWVLLHWDSDWRWMLQRCDSPWYPTMRLFRQPAPGDWHSVALQVMKELQLRTQSSDWLRQRLAASEEVRPLASPEQSGFQDRTA